MTNIVWIAMGGAFGAVARYLVSGWTYAWLGRGFPWGTLAVNVIGSFLMGFFFDLLTERLFVSPQVRSAILVGIFGAFTTFSTFSIETLNLIEEGATGLALANIAISVIVCLVAVWLGVLAGRMI